MKEEEMPETAYYNLKGTMWKQEQCSYEENCKTIEIVNRMQEETKIDSIVLGINQFLASPLLLELFKVILKPHMPYPWSKVKQKFFAWKNKIDLNEPIKSMQQWQLRRVLQDFFVFNIALMWNSAGSEFISTLISMTSKNLPMKNRDGKNQSIISPMETSISGI